LDYTDFFAMFGEGRHGNFRDLLDSKLAPHLSSSAYQFWRANEDAFSSAFYLRGYSGWAIYLMRIVFKIAGISQHVKDFCSADTLQEQARIWWEHLRPVMLNPVVVALMKNPVFCWNALGVPLNQRKMLLSDGTPSLFNLVPFSPFQQVGFTSTSGTRLIPLLHRTCLKPGHISIFWCAPFLTVSSIF
jgi:betaine lipid synthase